MNGLPIGEVAARTGVHSETLRYYERRGLVARPPRSVSNYRLYPPDTVRRRRGYAPFALGLLGVLVALGGRFALGSDPAAYTGLAVLAGAALWNSWPRVAAHTSSCAACLRPDQANKTIQEEALS